MGGKSSTQPNTQFSMIERKYDEGLLFQKKTFNLLKNFFLQNW